MATFEAQVEGLTGLAIESSSSNPTQAQLTEFLKDGVIDVTNKCLAAKPNDVGYFTRSSSESTSQYGLSNSVGRIISVVRETGTDGDFRSCRAAPISLQSRLTDADSLHFASKYNPAYVTGGDGSIGVFPAPAGSNNAYKIYYVNSTPVNGSDSTLIFSHSDINYFPEDKVYLVVIYASMKSLQNAMSGLDANTEFTTAVDAANIALDRVASYSWDDEDTFTTLSSQLTRVKAALDDAEDIIDGDEPSATTDAYGAQTAEDTELVASALNIAKTEISRAQVHIQEWNTILGGALQESQGFIQEANTRIQKLTQNYNWYAGRYKDLKAEYDAAFMLMRPPQPQQGAR